MIDTLTKYWHTLRYLKPIQIYGRLLYKVKRPKVVVGTTPSLRTAIDRWCPPARRRPSMIGQRQFKFLNQHGDLDQMGWDDQQVEKLWRYNLHYFDDLNAFDADVRRDWHLALIADWLNRNPPPKGSGWEPYPVSLRIVNWIKWSCSGGVLPAPALRNLAVQVRWLTQRLEWHLLGNHLFANAKALIFAGSFFEGHEAESWLNLGFEILKREVPEQILADGGQFELTPMYHALAVEDVLDLMNILTHYRPITNPVRQEQFADLERRVPDMLRWFKTMCHPDGEISFFNDAAIGIAPEPKELFGYAARLGFAVDEQLSSLHYLENSGYVRLSDRSAVLIADVAKVGPDYLPAHAHADTLSFELSLHGQRVIVNSGTSRYGNTSERLRQRGTAAHSTLAIDSLNSSEVWSGFRVARRATLLGVDAFERHGRLKLCASHDGYTRLGSKVVHRRSWTLENGRLEIADWVAGTGRHQIDILYYLCPRIAVEPLSDKEILLSDRESKAEIATLRAGIGADLMIEQTTWHPEFGLSVPNICVRLAADATLPFVHTTTLSWK